MTAAIAAMMVTTGLLAGCSGGETKGETVDFTLEDFREVSLADGGDTVTSDPDVVGIVKELRVVNDSIVALSQVNSDVNVVLYNLRSGERQVANRRGVGPMEITNVGSMSVAPDGCLLMAGVYDHKVIAARWNPDGGEALTEQVLAPAADYMKTLATADGRLVALPTPPSSSRLAVLDSRGEPVDSLGVFPVVELPDSVRASNYMFQADVDCPPSAGRVAVANKSWNEIELTALDGGETVVLRGPVTPELKIAVLSGPVMRIAPDPFWLMYSGVAAGDSLVAVGYIGVEVTTVQDLTHDIGCLLEFDWNGNPKRRLILADESTAFDIDYGRGVLFTVENRPDPTLVKYDINNL